MNNKYVVWLEEVDKHDIGLVGGKGANLGEMLNAGFPVPYGFIVTSKTYFRIIEENNLSKEIKLITSFTNFDNPQELNLASKNIQNLIKKATVPKDICLLIANYYEALVAKENKILSKLSNKNWKNNLLKSFFSNPFVAVRSSATAEDLPEASFAGQQETFLNVKGENHLIQCIRDCWASLFTERALFYREQNGFNHLSVGLAAVIQRMIQSDKSGIAFSIDPLTNNKKIIIIEAILGLGEYIVQGKVTPDHFEVSKTDFSIINKKINAQDVALIREGNKNIEKLISVKNKNQQKISDSDIKKIAQIVANIEKHYYFPQDIEWAIEGEDIYITQSRPITTIKKTEKIKTNSEVFNKFESDVILKGDPASPGIRSGKPVIVDSPKNIDMVKKGEVLVAPQTNPDYVPAMKRACAIVTELGGRTSHAAIISRELGIPAVVGAYKATKILKKYQIITVNGSTGLIYKGNITASTTLVKKNKYKKISTKTKIYVNLADPDRINEVSKMNVDGVGLLRAEFMIAQIGIHPKTFVEKHKESDFVRTLSSKIAVFAHAFYPRPVVYRATDFKTNEYRNLKNGNIYEPKEENPMIGWRGAARYITDKLVFKMELDVIRKVREKGLTNLYLMIPFVRSPNELIKIRNMIEAVGLFDTPNFKLWMMVETPSTALTLNDYIKIGIDGVSIGTNDLTMLALGVDRDNSEVSHLYQETNKAVIYLLKKIVRACYYSNISCSICGQAASDYPELVELLIKEGITSLSVNIDAVNRTREQVYEIENKLWQK